MKTGTIYTKTANVAASHIRIETAGVFYTSKGVDKFVPMHQVRQIIFKERY